MPGWRNAFALSKVEVQEATPPGTVQLDDRRLDEKALESGDDTGASTAPAVRFPQPSSDPADPLNWSPTRKTAILLVASLYAFIGNWQSAIVAPALSFWYPAHPSDFARPYTDLVRFIAVNVLLLGASNIWWVPLANILGRRPVLLVAALIMTLCSVWAALAKDYDSTLAARVFMGIGAGPSETVAPMLIGEVFFVAERGRAMAIYTAFLACGSLVSGIAGGFIAGKLGWAYIFWVTTALSGALFLALVFFAPETMYERRMESGIAPTLPQSSGKNGGVDMVESARPTASSAPETYRPYTFTRSLGFGRPNTSGVGSHFARPWRTLAFPATWVVMLHYAGLVGGIVTISTVGAQLVSMPPYLWGANAGLINVGALVGTLVGAVYTYLTADARLLKGKGRAWLVEPESRLPTMFPMLVVATSGFFVFGFCAQNPGPMVWAGLEVGYGMLASGLMQIPSVGFNYLIDSYGHLAGDCFVMITILRSAVAFAWTFFVSEWVTSRGAAEPFGIFGMLMALFGLLTIPLWLYGKRLRIATAGAVWMRE